MHTRNPITWLTDWVTGKVGRWVALAVWLVTAGLLSVWRRSWPPSTITTLPQPLATRSRCGAARARHRRPAGPLQLVAKLPQVEGVMKNCGHTATAGRQFANLSAIHQRLVGATAGQSHQ